MPAWSCCHATRSECGGVQLSTEVEIFTDGACRGNPGAGGWGAVLRYGDTEKELCGGEANTTNNRMELMGAIAALEALKRPTRVVLTTDSQYVRKGITQWLANWKRNGWKTSARKPVKALPSRRFSKAVAAAPASPWMPTEIFLTRPSIFASSTPLPRPTMCAGSG